MSDNDLVRVQEQLYLQQMMGVNKAAIRDLMPMWCRNVGENMDIARHAKSLGDMPRGEGSCIVVASAPSLTDEDILKLREFKGDIITVNKNFKRFIDLDILPKWVVLLDAHPVSMGQFRFVREYVWKEKPNFFVSTVVHPQTVRLLQEFAGEQFYMTNPVELSNEVIMECPKCKHLFEHTTTIRISTAWEWMNGLPEFPHGGNVGTCAFLLARVLDYSRIGMMGFDFYEKPNPEMSVHEALGIEHLYYPGFGTIAWPAHMKAYFSYMAGVLQDTAAEVRYLGNSPLFTNCPLVESESVEDFLEGK